MIIFNRPQRGIYNIKTNQDIGTMIKKDRMVRSSQMITISLMETGISVATTQGIVVELSLIHISGHRLQQKSLSSSERLFDI